MATKKRTDAQKFKVKGFRIGEEVKVIANSDPQLSNEYIGKIACFEGMVEKGVAYLIFEGEEGECPVADITPLKKPHYGKKYWNHWRRSNMTNC